MRCLQILAGLDIDKSLSRVRLFAILWTVAYQALCPWDFPGKSTGVGCHFRLQGIFLTQGLNPGLPHCRQTLYHLSHQESPYLIIVNRKLLGPRLSKPDKRLIHIDDGMFMIQWDPGWIKQTFSLLNLNLGNGENTYRTNLFGGSTVKRSLFSLFQYKDAKLFWFICSLLQNVFSVHFYASYLLPMFYISP